MKPPQGLGARLRKEREALGVGLDELSRATKIRRVFLEAMEAERWEEMPSPIFVAGYLKAVAQHLRADPTPWLAALEAELGAPQSSPPAAAAPGAASGGFRSKLTALGLAGAILAGGAVVAYLAVRERHAVPPGGVEAPPVLKYPPVPEAAPAPIAGAPAPEATPAQPAPVPPPAAASAPGEDLVLEARSPCWVELTAGPKRLVYRELAAGERLAFAGRSFRLTVGDAAAVRVTYRGKEIPLAGGQGTVVKALELGGGDG